MGIVNSIEIARSPEDVFAYLGQLDRHGEWQGQIVGVRVETEGPTRAGTRATEIRKVPGGPREINYELTEWDPPRRVVFKGLNGAIRANGVVSVEQAGEGRSRVTLDLEFEGHGFGKLVVPFARRDARKQVPKDQAQLKERLESGV